MEEIRVTHGFGPVYDACSRVLILGTMPSPKSREAAFYYMHPQNRFWRVLGAVLGCAVPEDVPGRRRMALEHGIALWDVLESCDIRGASDASIRDPVPNDIRPILSAAPIRAVFTTGTTAAKLYRRLILPVCGVEAGLLPSPSPANCARSFEELVNAYRVINTYR